MIAHGIVFVGPWGLCRLHLITGVQSAHQRVLRWFLIVLWHGSVIFFGGILIPPYSRLAVFFAVDVEDNGISRQLTARIHSNLLLACTMRRGGVSRHFET